jgi:ankyrin repeat domain-containing protein 50
LHASLQLAALCECTSMHEVKETLASFPTDIEDLYRKTWQRIFGQKGGKGLLARNVLTWVVFGTRSFTIEELQQAVAFHPETHKFDRDRMVPEATLIGLCHGLVTVEKATRFVRLVRKLTLYFSHAGLLTSANRLHCQGHLEGPHN